MNVYHAILFASYPFSIFKVTHMPAISSISFINILKMSETNYSVFSIHYNNGASRIFYLCLLIYLMQMARQW